MVKKQVLKKVEKKIKEYVTLLRQDKLPIQKVILFGSYAKGTQNKWSDVDVCIVSPRFKNSWQAGEYLWEKRILDMRYVIEPHGFNPTDFNDKYSSLAQEIKKTGIEIKV